MLIQMLSRSFRTLFSPAFLGLVIKTSLLTVMVFAFIVIGFLTWFLAANPFAGTGYADAAQIGAGVAAFFGIWFLLPTVVPLIALFFQESIADRIERTEYPHILPPSIHRPLGRELWEDVKFVILLLLINILIFPTIFLGIGVFAYFFVNAWFVGREFFETAAARHVGRKQAREIGRMNRTPILLGGAAIVLLSITPILNFTAPFIGVAMMVHLFHAIRKPVEILPPLQGADL